MNRWSGPTSSEVPSHAYHKTPVVWVGHRADETVFVSIVKGWTRKHLSKSKRQKSQEILRELTVAVIIQKPICFSLDPECPTKSYVSKA